MIGDHRVLAVVPARGGSKGIPGKNLSIVGGASLVARAAITATAMAITDVALISTDDMEIAREGQAHGLQFLGLRPATLASDDARSIEVWAHEWSHAEEVLGTRFEISVLLEPTSPMRTVADVERTIDALHVPGAHAAATVSRTPAHFTPHKTLLVRDDGTLTSLLPPEMSPTIRQQIPPQFHRNGLCYAAWRSTVIERRTITEEACLAVVVERPVVNIDEPFDLEFANWLLERHDSRSRDQ